jgi:hypothetical protein
VPDRERLYGERGKLIGESAMSVFVDATLLRFAQDAFVTDLLNGLGLTAIFNATFDATDIALESVTLGPVSTRSFKVPAFETVRSNGTDERIVPDTQRVRKERVLPRFGRLDWVDVAFDAVLSTKVQTLVAPLQSVTSQTLEQKLGGVASIADLRAKLLALYAPSVVDALFAKLQISTIEDFERQRHLFIELVGAAPPAFDPNDPNAARDFTVSVRVKVVDGFDVAGALQSAKLCRSILEYESVPNYLPGVDRTTPYALVTIFADAAVTDASLPGMTAAQAKTAVGALFNGERMFAQFIT